MIKIEAGVFYSIPELTDIASIPTLRKYIKSGELQASNVGGKYMVDGKDILDFLEVKKSAKMTKGRKIKAPS